MKSYRISILSFAAMAVFWSLLFHSWVLGIVFLVLLACHEGGHFVVARRLGMQVTPPVFLPIGAVINMPSLPRNARDEALMAYAGPFVGSVCAFLALFVAHVVGSQAAWEAGEFAVILNLFNLLPLAPLDGGRVSMAITRKLWVVGALGLAALVAFDVMQGDLFGLFIALFIGYIARQDVRMRASMAVSQPEYFALPLAQKLAFSCAYLGLAVILLAQLLGAHVLI